MCGRRGDNDMLRRQGHLVGQWERGDPGMLLTSGAPCVSVGRGGGDPVHNMLLTSGVTKHWSFFFITFLVNLGHACSLVEDFRKLFAFGPKRPLKFIFTKNVKIIQINN